MRGEEWPDALDLRGVTESVVTTLGPNGRWNLAALGLHAPEADGAGGAAGPVTARTWGRTRTWRNFTERGEGYVQFTRDPLTFVDAALSIREADDPVLDDADAWVRVEVERIEEGGFVSVLPSAGPQPESGCHVRPGARRDRLLLGRYDDEPQPVVAVVAVGQERPGLEFDDALGDLLGDLARDDDEDELRLEVALVGVDPLLGQVFTEGRQPVEVGDGDPVSPADEQVADLLVVAVGDGGMEELLAVLDLDAAVQREPLAADPAVLLQVVAVHEPVAHPVYVLVVPVGYPRSRLPRRAGVTVAHTHASAPARQNPIGGSLGGGARIVGCD
jgi:hypothetical protein